MSDYSDKMKRKCELKESVGIKIYINTITQYLITPISSKNTLQAKLDNKCKT